MREIILACGKTALVDDADFAICNEFVWKVKSCKYTNYAVRTQRIGLRRDNKKITIRLHNFIMQPAKGFIVDHIDGNGLNCQRSNMRLATQSQNHMNVRKMTNAQLSSYKGVTYDRSRNKWKMQLVKDRVVIIQKRFDNEIDAAKAYDSAARRYFGEFAKLNFPNE